MEPGAPSAPLGLGCGLVSGKGPFMARPQVVNYPFIGKPLGPKCVLE